MIILIVEVVVVVKVAFGVFEAFFGGLASRRFSTKLCCGLQILHFRRRAIVEILTNWYR